MPGLAGFVDRAHAGAERRACLDRMVARMTRESEDICGQWHHDGLGVGVGWTVHPGSFADSMPFWNETRDVCLFFTGEAFDDERESLKAAGHDVAAADDASYLVHLYEERGRDFVALLNGWFSGVVVDLRDQTVVLFTDRYGLGRIYTHEDEHGTYFASEAKALLRVRPSLSRLDPVGLAELASCGCVLQNRTLFTDVSLLPPASRWTFGPGRQPRKETYFDPASWEGQEALDDADYGRQLTDTFARVLPRYLRGPQPVAMSVTGGLDSRMIMAWAGRSEATLPCYTFGGSLRECSDVVVGRQVAHACGQPHTTIPVDGDFLRQFPALARRTIEISDGTMDVTGAVELYVNRIARTIAPVRLTGNYGSEILRRNVAFKPRALDPGIYDEGFVDLARRAAVTYGREASVHPLSFIAFKQVPWHHHARLSIEQSQLTLRAPYLDEALVRLAYQASSQQARSPAASLQVVAAGSQVLSRIPTDRGVLDRPTRVLGPLRRLCAEFTFRAEYAFDYGMPPWLTRIDHALAPLHLERAVLGRHKFYHFRAWYRGPLASAVKDVLLDPRTRRRFHVRGARLEALVMDHLAGRRNATTEIHKLLTIELIHRHLIDEA